MSIENKTMFLSEIEQELEKEIIMPDISVVMRILALGLSKYDLVKQKCVDASDDLLDAYLSSMKIEGRSELTIDRYRYVLLRMREAVNAPMHEITVYHLRKYLADEKERGISDRTLESTRQVFSAFFNWLQRENLIDRNPCANLGVIKYAKKQKDIYSDADIEMLKFECTNIRDRAIICFLKATGCRISEVTQLNIEDVDLVNLECTVFGKGKKERTVFLDQVAGMTLELYLKSRTDDSNALFIGKRGNRMTPHGIREMLVRLGASSNVFHVHPHKFRRTTATNLIRHGMPIQEVAAILGHDKLDTTMEYVVLNKADMKNSYRKYA